VRHYAARGHTVIALDEASHIIGWNTQNGWYQVGRPVRTPVSLSRKRFHSFGALHRDGFVCRFAERADSGSFIGFLEELRRRFGKVLIYLDNAGWHKSVAVKEYLDGCGGDVVLRHLPPYTPELNPVEVQWRFIRKATGNRLYESTDEMKESI